MEWRKEKMTTVILAEKPSQAKEYAQAMAKQTKKNGYFEIEDELFPEGAVVTYGFGHLVDLLMPQDYAAHHAKWSLENLPIFPETMQYKVSKDKMPQFTIVKKLLQAANRIIIATDCDREGELIAWLIIQQAGIIKGDKQVQRLWINSLEKEAIRKGFVHLKDANDTYPKFMEAQTRQMSDWLVGMNLSPLYTLSLQEKGTQGTFPIGRVQTPTLMMVYRRQKEIKQFQSKDYFELELQGKNNGRPWKATLKENQKFDTKQNYTAFLQSKQLQEGSQEVCVADIQMQEKETASPRLFSLSALQVAMSKQQKASPKQTLEAVQHLYEKKWLTYPRTDSVYITENEFVYLLEKKKDYQSLLAIQQDLNNTEQRTRYVNSKKVQEHHAIIPTKTIPKLSDLKALPPLEKNIYELVTRTTLAMFADPFRYEETIIDLLAKELAFVAKGKVERSPGWKSILKEPAEKQKEDQEAMLPALEKGTLISMDLQAAAKKTHPPKPFTEGTLIQAMKQAGKELDTDQAQAILKEVEGIGTEATRADVIERLKAQAYIVVAKNQLEVTAKGQQLGRVLEDDKLFSSAEMTAAWEKDLRSIGEEVLTQEVFLKRIRHLVKQYIKQVPETLQKISQSDEWKDVQQQVQAASIGNCPVCGRSIVDKGAFYGCEGYLDNPSCSFSISKKIRGKALGKRDLTALLSKGSTSVIKGFTSKAGKSFDAQLKIEDGKVQFVFPKR